MKPVEYRGFTITFDKPPIPASCGVDYGFTHPDYDADWDGDRWIDNGLSGHGKSVEHCKEQIDELIEELKAAA